MPSRQRTLGWIQDAGDLFKVRSIAEIFVLDSTVNRRLKNDLIPSLIPDFLDRDRFIFELSHEPISIPFDHLKGRGPLPGETRSNATCSGIAQAVLPAQNGRPYSSDWSTVSYIRLTLALGFLDYNRDTDCLSITQAGIKLVESVQGSEQEKQLFENALLSYPPACRVLQLLSGSNSIMSKFAIGQQLGFIGEKGFSSYPEYLIAEAIYFADLKESKRIRSNVEGTCDKYSRMICNWLKQLGWVTKSHFDVPIFNNHKEVGKVSLEGFRITLRGAEAFKRTNGTSPHSRIPKKVSFEMLATLESNAFLLRLRRANIINCLSSKKSSLLELEDYLESHGCWADSSVLKDDINGLINMGLNVKTVNNCFYVDDEIEGLKIPSLANIELLSDDYISGIKDELRLKLKNINHKYLSLVDYAFNSSSNFLFEIETIDLLSKELGLNAMHLGHCNKPDGILTIENHGVIIDNKSYSQGFSLPINQRREMKDYIDQNIQRNPSINSTRWWENFPDSNKTYSYLFVSSFFCGRFEDGIHALSAQTNVNGACLSVKNLLLLADKIKCGLIDGQSLIALLNSNCEILVE